MASLALVGVLLAACADDDDDDDADAEVTLATDLASPTAAGSTDMTPTEADGTATDATGGGTAEETESEDMATGTESEDVMGTATEEDDEATGTESDDGTATEAEGTSTEAGDDMTATEDDEDATGTEDEAEGTQSETDGESAELGETVEVGDLAITVEGLEDVTSAAAFVEPESGQRFVAIEVTIENTGSDDVTLFDVFSDLRLEDATGEEFDADLLANAVLLLEGMGITEPRIEPGSEVSGMIGFQVPEDEDELTLVIETDDGESVEIDLSDAQ